MSTDLVRPPSAAAPGAARRLPADENPVVRRLSLLREQWDGFAQEPEARLLRWLVTSAEQTLVAAWLGMESDERAARCPDVFVQMRALFQSSRTDADGVGDAYVAALRSELSAHLLAAGLPALPTDGRCLTASFLAACAELWRGSRGRLELLVLVLSPQELDDTAAWGQWLAEAAASCPVELRLLVLDDAAAPQLDAVERTAPRQVRSIAAQLDAPAMLTELSLQAGQTDSPGGRFRHRFLQMNAALATGDLASAQHLAGLAQAVAKEQAWPQMEVAALVALGAGAMQHGQLEGALVSYREAERIAAAADACGEPMAPQLLVKTRMAVAAGLLGQGRPAAAATLYESIAPRAETAFGALLGLDCWRMASFSHGSAGNTERALVCAERALDTAEQIDPETRAGSSLGFLAASVRPLLDATSGGSAAAGQALLRRLETLLKEPAPAAGRSTEEPRS